MSLITRIFGGRQDDRAAVRPLWHRIVEVARDRRWYVVGGVADTVSGRFDAITLILALVILRMERDEDLIGPSALLTELFVEDMDGQLRQSGVGDLVVGKHMGKLMSVLGGRLDALRSAFPQGEAAVEDVLKRNVTLVEGADTTLLAQDICTLHQSLTALSADDLLAGRFGP